ncbi:MAG: MucB/RseB C-terminal domain-containing protein, partial [Rubrivivax sp.]|nr:MucB/RseB C-terminal domain-containing protein [Rubrivivax sp.]
PADAAGLTDARAWLASIHAAARERNYEGTMVFTAGGVSSSSRVSHFCLGDQYFEQVESLDGRMQRVLRHNDIVQTVWPQRKTAVIESRNAGGGPRSLTPSVDPRALDQYELKPEGRERVAGREAQVFLLQPRDALRYAQRLWADLASGLMLRADVIGPANAVIESVAFSALEVGVKPQPELVLQAMKIADGYRVLRPTLQPTQLDAEGWALPRPVPGFAQTGCVKRSLETATESRSGPVLQAVFSDGLTHVSLFIEAFDARRHRAPLHGQIGATGTLAQRRGEHWITVMGDVPPATLKLFADALERQR